MNALPEALLPVTQANANDVFRVAADVRRFGKSSAYVDCSVTIADFGDLVAHAVLEFAF